MITVEEEKGGLRNIYFLSIFESIMQRVMEVCLRDLSERRAKPFHFPC